MVGAGVIGFSTALCVAEALPICSVTLLAEKFSPDNTSDGAAGILIPTEFPGMRQNALSTYNITQISPYILERDSFEY